jgi:hypothetical protein
VVIAFIVARFFGGIYAVTIDLLGNKIEKGAKNQDGQKFWSGITEISIMKKFLAISEFII